MLGVPKKSSGAASWPMCATAQRIAAILKALVAEVVVMVRRAVVSLMVANGRCRCEA
jgi:hypothetical protein